VCQAVTVSHWFGSARKVSNQEKYSTNNFNICNSVGCYGILSKVFRGGNPKSWCSQHSLSKEKKKWTYSPTQAVVAHQKPNQ